MAVLLGWNGKARLVAPLLFVYLLSLSHPASAQSMSCNPSSLTGGQTSTGTVSIPSPAPPGGTLVQLASGSPSYASVPANVTIPQGSLSTNFTVTTYVWYTSAGEPAHHMSVTIYSTNLPTATTVIDVLSTPGGPPTLVSLTLNPSSVVGGNSSTVTANLSGPAGAGGVYVSLSSNSPKATVPSSVYVPGGSSASQSGTVNTSTVTTTTTATITGTLGSSSANANLTIQPTGCDISATVSVSQSPVLKGVQTTIAAGVSNPSGRTLSYSWIYGDGTTGSGSSNAKSYSQIKLSNGVIVPYHVSVTVTDVNNPSCTTNASTDIMVYAGLGRWNMPGYGGSCSPDPFSGNEMIEIDDPVPTRGWPLANNVYFNTQTTESNRLLKNATFTYDIHITTEANYDDGGQLHWKLVDGTGRRLDFGRSSGNPSPEPGVFSTLVKNGDGTFVLQKAGEPGSIDTAGNFTYNFNSSKQLTLITDPTGNTQVLSYSNGLLTSVAASNTGRWLEFFNGGTYISIIHHDSSFGAGVTQVNFSGGRVSSVGLWDGGNNPLTTWQFTYDGTGLLATWKRDNNDASKVTYTYTAFPNHAAPAVTTPIMLANRSTSEGQTRYAWGFDPVAPAVDSVFVTNNKGGTFRYDFNSLGDVTMVTTPILVGAGQATVYTFG